MDVINNLSREVTDSLEYINNNKYLTSILGLFLALYAALAAPKLPKSITLWFDNTWFKLAFMFLIAYMATKDASVAIIAAVALLVTLQTLSAQKTTEEVVKAVKAKVEKIKYMDNMQETFVDTKVEVQPKQIEEPDEEYEEKPEDTEVKSEVQSKVQSEVQSKVQQQTFPNGYTEDLLNNYQDISMITPQKAYQEAPQEAPQEAYQEAPQNIMSKTEEKCTPTRVSLGCCASIDDIKGHDFGEFATI